MATVEEITDEPQVEQQEQAEQVTQPEHSLPKAQSKPNRGEKKSRKAMQKLGLKSITGINRATLKRAKNVLLVIESPEVMKSPNSETYVIFGEAKYEDLQQAAASAEADKFKQQVPQAKEENKIETVEEEEDDGEEIDEEGVSEENIKEVMEHGKCSRRVAVKALKAVGNDPVEAILKVS